MPVQTATPNIGRKRQSDPQFDRLVDSAITYVLDEGFNLFLTTKDIEDIKESLYENYENISSVNYNYSKALRVISRILVGKLGERLRKAEAKYEELLKDGVPESEKVKEEINSLKEKLKELEKALKDKDSSVSSFSLLTDIKHAYTEVDVLSMRVNAISENKELALKMARGEPITWAEADKLVVAYGFETAFKQAKPRSISLPPIGKGWKIASRFMKNGWKPSYVYIFKDRVEIMDHYLLLSFKLDKEANLPEGVKSLEIIADGDVNLIEKLFKEGIRVSIGEEHLVVEGSGKSVEISERDPIYKLVSDARRSGASYSVIEYTPKTGKLVSKLQKTLQELLITSTGHIAVEIGKDSISVLPVSVLGTSLVENTIDGVIVVGLTADSSKMLSSLLKASREGRIIIVDSDNTPLLNVEFTDEKGGIVHASVASYIGARVRDHDKIKEVDVVEVKSKPYLKAFIMHNTDYWENASPILVTHDGNLMIIGSGKYVYITPEKNTRISKPVKLNTSVTGVINLVEAGLIPITPTSNEDVDKLVRKAKEAYEYVKNAKPDETYTFKLGSELDLPHDYDLETYLVDLAYMLGFKREVTINIYNAENERIIELIPGKNVRVLVLP